ncbi:MAG: PepSY-associated TM helix domain-containing protein [Bacteroidota bacterium]
MKVFFRNIHLYLGLCAGLVIMTTCFTGAALVFEKELQTAIYPERYKVQPTGAKVSLERMISMLKAEVPGAKVSSAKVYDDPARSVELSYSIPEKENENGQAFMNPYTGKLISLYKYRNTFFYTMFALHRWLLAEDAGKLIVGISTSIFLFILITGIILWWPKNKKKLKSSLRLKWGAGWKRVNHDLHVVIGFYAAIFLFAFAFTGLAWSFHWFNDGIYWVTGTESKRPDPPSSVFQADTESISFDEALTAIQNQVSNATYYHLNAPRDSSGAFAVTILSNDPVHEKATDQYFLDQYTADLLGTYLYRDRNLGQRVRSTFYPVHVGSIGGLPGRIIAFLSCIAGVTFPVTGIIMWINRLRKEKRKKKKKAVSTSVHKKVVAHEGVY